jgi:hypothetical protein
MSKTCAVCPNFVMMSCKTPSFLADSLFVFTQDNDFRLAMDLYGRIAEFYESVVKQEDDETKGHLAYWLRMLAKTSFRSVEFIKYQNKTKNYRTFSIGLAKAIKGEAIYIVWSRQDYLETHLTKLGNIVLEREDAVLKLRQGRDNQDEPIRKLEDVMIDLITAATIIKATADAVGIVDKISHAMSVFRKSDEVIPVENAKGAVFETVTMSADGTELTHRVSGQEQQVVTLAELTQRLGNQDLQLIQMYDKQLSQLFDQWITISNEYEVAGVGEQARLKGQLKIISEKMAKALNSTLKFIEKMGFTLGDHYEAIRAITEGA